MRSTLERCLEDLEARLDDEVESALYREWVEFTDGEFEGDIFSPRRARPAPPGIEWPAVRVNQTLDDYDMMALRQFGACSQTLADGTGEMLGVRSSYGTSIIPSLFGVELFIMDDEADTLPTSWPIADTERIEKLVEAGAPDLHRSLGGKTLEMAERFEAIRRAYPKIGRYVHHYHPDLQGPMDIVEVLWGSGLFPDLYDRPELVKAVLELITETYERFLRAWVDIVPWENGRQVHWRLMHAGRIMLRDDSAMNLSPEMFDEFIAPYDQRLLDAFGGGAIHFCGRGDHYIESMSKMDGMHAIAMSQPEYNDMEVIYRHTVDREIKLLGLHRATAEAALSQGRALHGRVHCW